MILEIFDCGIKKEMHKATTSDHRYIILDLKSEDAEKIKKVHKANEYKIREHGCTFVDPLHDIYLKVKVPFRYNRVTCKVNGIKTIQEIEQGDIINRISIQFCGVWTANGAVGFAWKLVSIDMI
jgi:hypothetical protein